MDTSEERIFPKLSIECIILRMSFVATNSSDNTETISFDVSGMASGASLTLATPCTAARTITFPDASVPGNDLLIVQATPQFLNGKTFTTDTTPCVFANASDSSKQVVISLSGAGTGSHTTLTTATTASCTITFPDSSVRLPAAEYSWIVPEPLLPNTGYYSSGYISNSYVGAAYSLPTTVVASTIYVYATAGAGASDCYVGFYQSADGSANTSSAWNLVTSANINVGTASGVKSGALASAPITFQPGVVVVIWLGTDTQTQLMGTYAINTLHMLNGATSSTLVSVLTQGGTTYPPPSTITPNTANVGATSFNVALIFGLD